MRTNDGVFEDLDTAMEEVVKRMGQISYSDLTTEVWEDNMWEGTLY